MDTFTQMVLGAAVGQATARRALGRSALAIGALGGLIPDLDTFATRLMGPFAEWQFHRGVTHSVFFGPLAGPVLGYALWRSYRRWFPTSRCAARTSLGPIVAVMILAILTHPLLDLFTIYGTQLLAPFSNARFAIPAVPIIDPAYTLILLAALTVGAMRGAPRAGHAAATIALTLSSAYLFYGWSQNQQAEAEARRQLALEGLSGVEVRAYTTIFQPWLRRVVATDRDGIRIGFISTWAPSEIMWTCLRRPDGTAVQAALTAPEAQILMWFADGQVWPELRRDPGGTTVRLTDLRYGAPGATIAGWWGVDVALGPDGQPAGARRIATPREVSASTIAAVIRAGYGDIAGLYETMGAPMPTAVAGGAAPCAAG